MGFSVRSARGASLRAPPYWLACLTACTAALNDPINTPMTADPRQVEAELSSDVPTNYDDMVVALSFSGGGTRAAAFSYGVLQGFEQTRVPTRSGPVSLLDRLDFLSGVSGGSILAAYYGLKGREGYADFKQRFLLANGEENLQTDLSLVQYRARAWKAASTTERLSGLARRASL